MIVGTAGHIDHGKTTLVRALTGVDTDRLPEEKKRGISIELGYAYLDGPTGAGERIGFVDVPGHERLVATMLAGATGIDFALLLVAADDGVMPQTREHLAVLSLLGVERGAIVVTKADRASGERLAAVEAEVRALVRGTALAAAPHVAVAAHDGRGIAALRDLLFDEASRAKAATSPDLGFRLAVDRVFSLAGAGTVVTGTAHAGTVAVGDELAVAPGDGSTRVRVRSIHAQNTAVERAHGGQRVALALVGVERAGTARGRWLVEPTIALSSTRLDVELELWRDEARALRSGTTVHLHAGAGDTLASVAVLGPSNDGVAGGAADAVAPGARAFVQLVVREPVCVWRGDRIVLRDASATRTVAGGRVLDPFAPARYRRTSERLAALAGALAESPDERLAARLRSAPDGVDAQAWRRAEGLRAGTTAAWPPGALIARRGGEVDAALGAEHARAWSARTTAALAAFHRDRPDDPGPDLMRLRRLVAPRSLEPIWRASVDRMLADGAIERRGACLSLPGHGAQLSAAEQRIVERASTRLLEGGFDPPWVRTLAADARIGEAAMRAALSRAAQRGELHQVVKDLFYPAPTLSRAAALVREIAARDGAVTASAFRDASGLGRKRAIQIVEYFDRIGLLCRVGDVHRVRADCELFGSRATA